MKFTKLYFAIIALSVVFCLQSCNEDESKSIEGNNSRLQLKLVDAPGDYLEVNVNIIDVQYNSSEDDEGWRSFESFDGPVIVDLTELIADNSLLLTDEIIEAGMLKQIRLVLGDDNTLVVDEGEIEPGTPIDLKTPSAQQSGLKMKLNASLEPGFSYTYILDWDVQKSIVKAGNSGQYILKPVINASAEVNSGSISGNVIDSDAVVLENVIVMAYLSTDLENSVASSMTNIDGDFLIQGLDPTDGGNGYILKINHGGFEEFMTEEADKISVIAGEITTLSESIELLFQKSIIGIVIDTDGAVEGATGKCVFCFSQYSVIG